MASTSRKTWSGHHPLLQIEFKHTCLMQCVPMPGFQLLVRFASVGGLRVTVLLTICIICLSHSTHSTDPDSRFCFGGSQAPVFDRHLRFGSRLLVIGVPLESAASARTCTTLRLASRVVEHYHSTKFQNREPLPALDALQTPALPVPEDSNIVSHG